MGVELKRVDVTKMSNVVTREKYVPVLRDALEMLSNTIGATAGPYGGKVILDYKDPTKRKFTKDGHTVAKSITIRGALEEHIRDEIVDATTHIVESVGDGTTSMAMLTNYFAQALLDYMDEHPETPVFMIREKIKEILEEFQLRILANAQEFEPVDAYDVAFTSTNGDKLLTGTIAEIYKEVGSNCFINVDYSNSVGFGYIREDGISIGAGYLNPCFANSEGLCKLADPHVYLFYDPIFDNEMISAFKNIIINNIMQSSLYVENGPKPVPTVIIAPGEITRDLDPLLDNIRAGMIANPGAIPLCIIKVPTIANPEYKDIQDIFGNKTIRKFVAEKTEEDLIKEGSYVAPDKVYERYITCPQITISNKQTIFTLPDDFDMSFIEAVIARNKAELAAEEKSEKASAGTIGILKRRIHALENNCVTLYVAGLTNMDTEAMKASVEDAILNCRSCAEYGYGYGSMFEMCNATDKMIESEKMETDPLYYDMFFTVKKAINDTIRDLYVKSGIAKDEADRVIVENIKRGRPINLRNHSYADEDRVLTSIRTDVEIIEALKTTILDMILAPIVILENPLENVY